MGRVAGAADDDSKPAQLRPAQHLDGGDELVEVDVQDPAGAGHASQCGVSPRANAPLRSVCGSPVLVVGDW
ncbi:MAG: hypothetical protein ACRD29_16375 [Acidimicrobiales bacterium]